MRALVKFFLLTFALSWAAWLSAAALGDSVLRSTLFLLGTFAPAIVALLLGETRPVLMLVAIVFSTWAQAGEEMGWRGFALPRLTSKCGLVRASLVLGVIWAAWHLPLFFVPAADTYGQSFPVFLLEVTALSVALAWLYWRTGGSLLLVMILHAAINNTKDIVPSVVPGATHPWGLSNSPTAWLTVGLLWISAAFFAWRIRGVAELS